MVKTRSTTSSDTEVRGQWSRNVSPVATSAYRPRFDHLFCGLSTTGILVTDLHRFSADSVRPSVSGKWPSIVPPSLAAVVD